MKTNKLSSEEININASLRACDYPTMKDKIVEINEIIKRRAGFDINYQVETKNGLIIGYVPENKEFNPKWFCKIMKIYNALERQMLNV